MLWGQSYVLPMTWGGGGIWGAPFGRHAALRLFHLFNWITFSAALGFWVFKNKPQVVAKLSVTLNDIIPNILCGLNLCQH